MTKSKPKSAAKHEEYDLEAGSKAVAEAVVACLNREMAQVPPRERRAWFNRWMRRRFGPGVIAAGLQVDEHGSPPRKPKTATTTPRSRTKAQRRTGSGRHSPRPGRR